MSDEKLQDDRVSYAVDAVLAEYSALRDEIGRYHDHEKQAMNFCLLAVLGGVTVAASSEKIPQASSNYCSASFPSSRLLPDSCTSIASSAFGG
jgi:hypothetical protein